MTRQRALPGVDLGGLVGVERDAARSSRAGGRCPGCAGSWPAPTRTPPRRAPAVGRRSADSPSRTWAHFSSAVRPGTRLVVAMAPAFTIGFMVRLSFSSTAIDRVERQAGGVDPEAGAGLVRRRSPRRPARTRTAWTRSGWRTGAWCRRPRCTWPSTFDDARAEQVGRAPRRGRGCSRPPCRRRSTGSVRRPPRGGAARPPAPGAGPSR